MINEWQSLEIDERRSVLGFVSIATGMIENAVEKDWWVIIVLKALFQSSCADSLIFKGGTSLSKGWELISRFSEDVDLAIDRSFFGFSGELTKKQRTQLRKKSLKYIREELTVELDNILREMGVSEYSIQLPESGDSDKDPELILVPYTSIIEGSNTGEDYIQFQVKIEISCRSLHEPYDDLILLPLIAEQYPQEEFSKHTEVIARTVLPSRTFLEKAFLLHEEFQKKEIRAVRMSRHLYDLEKLMDTDYAKQALEDPVLYATIVKHRHTFTKLGEVDYKTHHPSTINFMPPNAVVEEWRKDYIAMQQNFIYGESLPFEKLLERIEELIERFRTVTNEDAFFKPLTEVK